MIINYMCGGTVKMLPQIVINVYCHDCGKICSSNIHSRTEEEWKEFIESWLKIPYCIECVQQKMRSRVL